MKRPSLAAVGAAVLSGTAQADPAGGGSLSVEPTELGRYTPEQVGFDEGGAENVAFDADTERLFVANGSDGTVDVLDASDPGEPELAKQVSLEAYGTSITGVAAAGGLAAVAVHPEDARAEPGTVVVLDTDSLEVLADVEAGFLPDAVVFSPDRSVAMVANEGEPNDAHTLDPEGW